MGGAGRSTCHLLHSSISASPTRQPEMCLAFRRQKPSLLMKSPAKNEEIRGQKWHPKKNHPKKNTKNIQKNPPNKSHQKNPPNKQTNKKKKKTIQTRNHGRATDVFGAAGHQVQLFEGRKPARRKTPERWLSKVRLETTKDTGLFEASGFLPVGFYDCAFWKPGKKRKNNQKKTSMFVD